MGPQKPPRWHRWWQRRVAALLLTWLTLLAGTVAAGAAEMRHDVELPAKPQTTNTVHVCMKTEVPGCYPSIRAALAEHDANDLRIVVHCGHYRGDTADLMGVSNLVLEGAPCSNGRLPILDAQGKSTRRIGAYPWMGASQARDLWVENLEFRNSHVSGNGTPIRVGGTGTAMFRNVIMTSNDNGILVSSLFSGTIYVVDSVFRDNGYGKPARTHHIYNACATGCRLVVLDSYFGKVFQGGNHIRVRGYLTAIGNMFLDEPGGESSRIVNLSAEACRLEGPGAPLPCTVAENYMLKNQWAHNRQFINVGDSSDSSAPAIGLIVRDNVALGLRTGALFVSNTQPNSSVVVHGNVLVLKDPDRCTATGIGCLVAVRDRNTDIEGNVISGDPDAIPTLFDRRVRPEIR